MINKEDKIIIVGAGHHDKTALMESLKEKHPNLIIVDDAESAKELLKGEYHKEVEKVYKYQKPELHNHWAGDLTKKQMNAKDTEPVRSTPKIQNNEPCPCGSGKKYKKCCK